MFKHAHRKLTLLFAAAILFCLGALSASISTAQQPQQAKSWQFEVAAIKPSDPKLEANSYSSTRGAVSGGEYAFEAVGRDGAVGQGLCPEGALVARDIQV
jgi:hypothetical protein